MRLRRHDGRLDRPGARFPHGLGVRRRRERQHRAHRRARPRSGTSSSPWASRFGNSLHHATTTLCSRSASLSPQHRERFVDAVEPRLSPHWHRSRPASGDGGRLYHASHSLLLAHEDKTYPGAMIASLSIPWGEVEGRRGPRRLSSRVDARHGEQHDRAAGLRQHRDAAASPHLPRVLAAARRRIPPELLDRRRAVLARDPARRGRVPDPARLEAARSRRATRFRSISDGAAGCRVSRSTRDRSRRRSAGRRTAGYSPSTLASNIAALTCAAGFAHERGDQATAAFLQRHADFLECHVEAWTVTTDGTLVPGVTRHFIRIRP